MGEVSPTSTSKPASTPTSTPTSTSTVGAVGLVVALVGGFALLPQLFHPRASDAPDFALDVVANGSQLPGNPARLHLEDLRGSAVLIDFWATWCGPCRIEAPIVDRIARRWHDKGVVVVGVNEDTPDQGDPREFALAEGLSYPIARDPTGQAMRRFDADSLPTLVVVSRSGKVTAIRAGITDDAELERLLRQALQPSQAL
jgi:cytochrome c biogenesis protein CcmG/thiol:disulfide interchange protein DsbE